MLGSRFRRLDLRGVAGGAVSEADLDGRSRARTMFASMSAEKGSKHSYSGVEVTFKF